MSKRSALSMAFVGLFVAASQGLMAAPVTRRAPMAAQRMNDVTVNPLGLAFGLGNVSYERALNRENSWTVGANFGSYGVAGNSLTILGAGGAYRWWFNGEKALDGWFLGPELKVETVNWAYDVTGTKYTANGSFFGGGVQGGYQWVFNNGFTLNLGLNYDYLAGSLSSSVSGAPTVGFGGAGIGANFGLGYAF